MWFHVDRVKPNPDYLPTLGQAKGAPALHYSQQQVNLLFTNVIEQTISYFPPGWALDKTMSMTIVACDALDGKSDGVVSRTDLCKLHFDIDDVVGEPYSCDAIESKGSLRSHVAKSTATPAQSDIVMA
ncbi:Carboxylic ester hydrolase [Fusarium keratoplasticum]|nr:Carboxylic ester hydrolase [Fusarium keratoplasticum]